MCNLTFKNLETGELSKIDFAENSYFEKYENVFDYTLKENHFEFDIKNDLNLCELLYATSCEITYVTTIEDKNYKIKIGNIPFKYIRMKDNDLYVPDIINEYCMNIVVKLYGEGYRFDEDKVIDFQEYLV